MAGACDHVSKQTGGNTAFLLRLGKPCQRMRIFHDVFVAIPADGIAPVLHEMAKTGRVVPMTIETFPFQNWLVNIAFREPLFTVAVKAQLWNLAYQEIRVHTLVRIVTRTAHAYFIRAMFSLTFQL